MIKNQEAFEKALETLNENDRKTLEAFAHFLLVSSNSSLVKDYDEKLTPEWGFSGVKEKAVQMDEQGLLDRANKVLLKDYVELTVSNIEYADGFNLNFYFAGRDRPVSFPDVWLNSGRGLLTNGIKSLFVKFRPGTNRIDKVAFDEKFLTECGKTESKKRILVLSSNKVIKNAEVPLTAANLPAATDLSPGKQTASQFLSSIIDTKITSASSNGWVNTPATAQISVPKNHIVFSKLDSFKEGRLKLSRVGEILFNFLDQSSSKKYVWDSEFFFGSPHDFTNIKTGKTYDIKCHFHTSERLQISQQTLNKCDADFIVAVLVEEDANTYTATVVGFVSREDFTNKTKPWAYNEYVELRSMELYDLNSPKDLF